MLKYLVITENTKIPMYNVMLGIGLIAGFVILDYNIKKQNLADSKIGKIYFTVIISLFAGFIGSLCISSILINKSAFSFNGLTFYGGLIFGSIALLITTLLFKLQICPTLNLLAPSLIIGHAFGRIGCFFAGCCHGVQTKTIFGVSFPEQSIPFVKYGRKPIHPTQLYEAFFLFVLFFIIQKISHFRFRVAIYFVSYGIFRFCVEFIRGDERGSFYGIRVLSPSQIFSLFFILTGLAILIYELKSQLLFKDVK